MAKGRPRKPVEQKRAEGTARSDRDAAPLLVGGRGEPTKPPGLLPAADAMWDEHVPLMSESGLLDRCDGMILGSYFNALAMADAAVKEMDGEVTYLSVSEKSSNVVKHPAFGAWKDATATALRIASEYGLTPAARAKLGAGGAPSRPVEAAPGAPPAQRELRVIDGGKA